MFSRRPTARRQRALAASFLIAALFAFGIGNAIAQTLTPGLGVIQTPTQLSFAPINPPVSDGAKGMVRTTSKVAIDSEIYPLHYQVILRSGDRFASGVFGRLVDINGEPILDEEGEAVISNMVDYSSLLPRGETIYMVTHFENTPSAIYLSTLAQDPETGLLAPVDTQPIDLAPVNGVLEACAGVTTAWSSHLGSEEWDPDAKAWDPETGSINDEDYDEGLLAYWGPDGELSDLNPYDYGWTTEISVDADGNATVVKHYAMGRFTHELAYVMPDNKTAYMTDDETNGGFFLFVADEPEDLSAGALYAAKWLQTGDEDAGSADLQWIKLGQATDAEIRALIDERTQFADLFEETEASADGMCPAEFTSINTTTGHECLQVKPGMEQAAAFLETRRYAALLGATTEFAANEGLAFDAESGTLYVATSGIGDGMLDGEEEYDLGGNNDIRLTTVTSCAGIYGMSVAGEQSAYTNGFTTDGAASEAIASDYVVVDAFTELMGREWTEAEATAQGVDYQYNVCDVNGIAEPDNLAFIPGAGVLLIAQDSEEHENDYLWAYNTRTQKLTRIQSGPQGSELSSPYFHSDINGFAYLTSAIQHPFDQEELIEDLGYPEEAAPMGDDRGAIGYIGPLPKFEHSE